MKTTVHLETVDRKEETILLHLQDSILHLPSMDNSLEENVLSGDNELIVVLEKGFESFPLQTVQYFLSKPRSECDHSLQQVSSTIKDRSSYYFENRCDLQNMRTRQFKRINSRTVLYLN